MKSLETFCVLVAYTDPQKVCEAFTGRNRLLCSYARVGERDTVPKGRLTNPANRAGTLGVAPFEALLGASWQRSQSGVWSHLQLASL